MITIVKDSILNAKEKYIVHQANAVSNQAGGLAFYIFQKFPYADIYKGRPYPYKPSGTNFPGHCVIKGDGKADRYVVNLIGQYFPGSPHNKNSLLDGSNTREGYFNTCLKQLSHIPDIESIAFPFNIGCGLAGGDWNNYFAMIKAFATEIHNTQSATTTIYDNSSP